MPMKKIIEELVLVLQESTADTVTDQKKEHLCTLLEQKTKKILKITTLQLQNCSAAELSVMEKEIQRCMILLRSMIHNIDAQAQQTSGIHTAFGTVKGFLLKQQEIIEAMHTKIVTIHAARNSR